jgi:VDE lipocalin domain
MSAHPFLRILQVGTCLLESCQLQLAACVADGNCLQDLICLNTCNGRPDESDCQVGRIAESRAPQTWTVSAAGASAVTSRNTRTAVGQWAASRQECQGWFCYWVGGLDSELPAASISTVCG